MTNTINKLVYFASKVLLIPKMYHLQHIERPGTQLEYENQVERRTFRFFKGVR